MDAYELWVFRGVGIIIVFFLQDYLRMRLGMSEKFVLKEDCKENQVRHKEDLTSAMLINKEAHQTINEKLDRIQKEIFEIIKGIDKINGGRK